MDWGLGHATRCIPIVKALLAHDFEVLIAADGRPLELLMKEFPQLEFVKLPGYNIRYPKNGNMAMSMLWQSRKIWRGIKQEHKALQGLIADFEIDGVISDNRFGLYSKKVPSVFMTHQLKIQAPYFEAFIKRVNYKYIRRFDECWVPDSSDHALSGVLTQVNDLPIEKRFLGPLSRFESMPKTEDLAVLAIVSGPEPQRSIFEKLLRQQLKALERKALLVLGKPEVKIDEQDGMLRVLSHLDAEALNQAMVNADVVLSRSGYSTIMDLAALGKKAVFVPTPGQTEQLYLAELFYKNKVAYAMHQHELNMEHALKETHSYTGFQSVSSSADWEQLFQLFQD